MDMLYLLISCGSCNTCVQSQSSHYIACKGLTWHMSRIELGLKKHGISETGSISRSKDLPHLMGPIKYISYFHQMMGTESSLKCSIKGLSDTSKLNLPLILKIRILHQQPHFHYLTGRFSSWMIWISIEHATHFTEQKVLNRTHPLRIPH